MTMQVRVRTLQLKSRVRASPCGWRLILGSSPSLSVAALQTLGGQMR